MTETNIKNRIAGLMLGIAALLMAACTPSIPTNSEKAGRRANLYPDYTDIVMPYNIAPMNFLLQEKGEACIVRVSDSNGNTITASGDKKMRIHFSAKEWKSLLSKNKGKELTYDIYVKANGKWLQYEPFKNGVAPDAIDPYLTYRLIEPSYMSTGNIGLFQFNLETSEQKPILTNHKRKCDPASREQSCMNCHVSQQNNPENSMFYYRGKGGGMIMTYQGKVYKVNTKAGDMFAGTVYSSWHPTLPLIAFSSNEIRQSFLSKEKGKIFVYDFRSDLVLYDIKKNEMTHILKTKDKQETFPSWSPDGKYLYFCSSDSTINEIAEFKKMKYDIKRIPFNEADKTWGEVEDIYHASTKGISASHPKISPDGKFMIFTIAPFGPNAYTQKEADLYLMNLETKEVSALDAINSNVSECYHAWASSGRWFVFLRREDGNYGRPYFSYFDKNGKAHRPFVIPHTDADYNMNLIKSYNATEFLLGPVEVSQNEFYSLIEKEEAIQSTYGSEMTDSEVDTYSGASKIEKN